MLVKEGVEGAPVESGPVPHNQKPSLNTPLEADHPGPAELSPDHPNQTQDFRIGNILTEGKSDGDQGEEQKDNGGRNQTEKRTRIQGSSSSGWKGERTKTEVKREGQ